MSAETYRTEPRWHCLQCGSSIVVTRNIEVGPPNPETVEMEFCANCGGEYDGE